MKLLGVQFESDLSLEKQDFPSIVKAHFFHLRALSRVYSLFTHKAANAVVVCLILSKLDYCNSLLAGLPHFQILQAAQNVAARVMVRQKNMISSPSTLRELHWLPVQDCILLKLLSDT